MKSRILFIAIFCLSTMVQLCAQPKFNLYPDSIRLEFPDQNAIVVFEMRDYPHSNDYIKSFPNTLKAILAQVKKGIPNSNQSAPQRIDVTIEPEGMKEVGITTKPYGEKQLITIRPQEKPATSITILLDKGVVELLPPGWELYITSKDYKVKVYGTDFAAMEAVANQDFSLVTDKINTDKEAARLKRSSIQAEMVIRENKIEKSSLGYVFPGDNIFLTAVGGVGLVQNTFYPELSIKLGLSFKDRQRRPSFRTSLVYNYMFLTEKAAEGYQVNTNSFLSGTFERNFNRKTGQSDWSGIGIGFLVNRTGDYFKGNTAKFYITHTVAGSRFSVVPEFYLTDDYKKFLFGVTLKFTF